MAASLDRSAFFKAIRSNPFTGSLTQSQVEGITHMLDEAPPAMPTRHLAHCFAEAYHETGGAMLPRVENLNYSSQVRLQQVWPTRFLTYASATPYVRNPVALAEYVYGGRLGNRPGTSDAWIFRGMGLVQATGRDNAVRATSRLRDLGYLTREQDLALTPSLMLDPDVAAAMLYAGLTEGWYTGKKLSQYFNDNVNDPIGARAMVNGDVKANGPKVAAVHNAFLNALTLARYTPNGIATTVPVPPVTTTPLAPPVAPKPAPAPAPVTPAPPPIHYEPSHSLLSRLGRWIDTTFGDT